VEYFNGFYDAASIANIRPYDASHLPVAANISFWSVEQSSLALRTSPRECDFPDVNWSDGYVEVEMQSYNGLGILLRSTDTQAILVNFSPTQGTISVYEYSAANWNAKFDFVGLDVPLQSQWALWRVRVKGADLFLYCNGVLVGSQLGLLTTLTSGAVGLRYSQAPGTPTFVARSIRADGYTPGVVEGDPWLDGVGSGWRVTDDARALMQTAVSHGNYFQGRTMDGGYGAVLGEAEPVLTPGWGSFGNPAGNLFAWSEQTLNAALVNGAFGNWNPATVTIAAWPAPDGLNTAQMIQATAPAQTTKCNLITVAPGDRITVSCYINNENAADVMFAFISGLDGNYVIDEYGPTFDLIGGWVRYEHTFTVQPGSNQCQAVLYIRNPGYVGVWGFQMVHGENAGAYTKTAGTPMPPGTTPYFVPADPAVGSITFVDGAVACILDDGTPPATWANGLPFSADGRLIVNGTDPLVNWVNGLPFTERALRVNNDFLAPPTEPPVALSVDPFFTTELGAVWLTPFWGPVGSYAEADVWLNAFDTGLYQAEPWIATSTPVTFFVRLKAALGLQTTFGMTLVSDDGGTTQFIGNLNIPAGQVYGSVRIVLPVVASNFKNLGFGYASGPTGPGGPHVESFGLTRTQADGGPPQVTDPYFSAPGAVWVVSSGATMTGNVAGFPSVPAYIGGPLALAPGDVVQMRVYVESIDEGATLIAVYGSEADHVLVKGWNAFSQTVTVAGTHAYIALRVAGTGVRQNLVHFFAAGKQP
jgi:hypothetical protein